MSSSKKSRPQLQLYQPGMGLPKPSKTASQSKNEGDATTHAEDADDKLSENVPSTNRSRSKAKKPELQRYVCPGRLKSVHLSTESKGTSEKAQSHSQKSTTGKHSSTSKVDVENHPTVPSSSDSAKAADSTKTKPSSQQVRKTKPQQSKVKRREDKQDFVESRIIRPSKKLDHLNNVIKENDTSPKSASVSPSPSKVTDNCKEIIRESSNNVQDNTEITSQKFNNLVIKETVTDEAASPVRNVVQFLEDSDSEDEVSLPSQEEVKISNQEDMNKPNQEVSLLNEESSEEEEPLPPDNPKMRRFEEMIAENGNRTPGETTKRKETRKHRSKKVGSAKKYMDISTSVSQKAGIIVLPSGKAEVPTIQTQRSRHNSDRQKHLYDPKNPNKPQVVKESNKRTGYRSRVSEYPEPVPGSVPVDVYYQYQGGKKGVDYLLTQIRKGEGEINYFINTNYVMEQWDRLLTVRRYLFECFKALLLEDLKYCEAQNVEQWMWKVLFYQLIEYIRKSTSEQTDPAIVAANQTAMRFIIEEGLDFLDDLLRSVERAYGFLVDDCLAGRIVSSPVGIVRLGLVAAQKLLLCMGDLCRYKEQISTEDSSQAKKLYLLAMQLNPKNGRPFNQLAILSLYGRRKLDAVYFYMRSITASNPFQSARENLILLFDDARKKWELDNKKEKKESFTELEKERIRREIWIRTDSGVRESRTTSTGDCDEEEGSHLKNLSGTELHKRFSLSFIHVHGKLFSKVGMEGFREAAMTMLQEFRALLWIDPIPFDPCRLVQINALNMFAIDAHELKDACLEEDGAAYRSVYQENGLIMYLQMLNLILERTNQILSGYGKKIAIKNMLTPDLNTLLSSVTVCCQWLMCHKRVWDPPPSFIELQISSVDVWSRCAELVNLLMRVEPSSVTLYESFDSETMKCVFPYEDSWLCFFQPLTAFTFKQKFADINANTEEAEMCIRMERIRLCGEEYLCGLDPPVLRYNPASKNYVSAVTAQQDISMSSNSSCSEHDVAEQLSSFDEDEDDFSQEEDDDMARLRRRRDRLRKKKVFEDRHREKVQAILDYKHSVTMEVRPRYLVPDTNCFINHLKDIEKLSTSRVYTLVVPLVVVKELEGLARSHGGSGYKGQVGSDAKRAIDYVRGSHEIKFVTTKGTSLSSCTFTTEDGQDVARNDDLILACCVNFKSKDSRHSKGNGDNSEYLYRDLVLLTEDRNLRVKAMTLNVAVRELPDFMEWAGVK